MAKYWTYSVNRPTSKREERKAKGLQSSREGDYPKKPRRKNGDHDR